MSATDQCGTGAKAELGACNEAGEGGIDSCTMSTLVDVLLEILESGFGPSSDRGMVATTAAASLAFASATLWLTGVSATPISQPAWGLLIFAGSLISGSAGVLVSWLHLRRTKDRLFALLCLTPSVAAIAIPAFWLMTY